MREKQRKTRRKTSKTGRKWVQIRAKVRKSSLIGREIAGKRLKTGAIARERAEIRANKTPMRIKPRGLLWPNPDPRYHPTRSTYTAGQYWTPVAPYARAVLDTA
eukprot:2689718-Rhodomonas_salina.1